MSSIFMNGFADELIKEAGSGLGGRLSKNLLKKTIGVESAATTAAAKAGREAGRAKRLRDATIASGSLKGRALGAKDAVMAHGRKAKDAVASKGRELGKMTKEQWAKLSPSQKKAVMAGGGLAAVGGASYVGSRASHGTGDGGGLKNLKGRQSATFTADAGGGKVGNPTENPENFKKKAGFTDGYSIGSAAKAGRVTGPKAGKGVGPMKEVNLGGGARSSRGVPKAAPPTTAKSLLGSVTGKMSFGDMPALPGQKKTPSSSVTVGKATRLPGSPMAASSRKALGN